MPIFEYACQDCGKVAEFLEARETQDGHTCPDCGGDRMTRLLSVFSGRVKQSPQAGPACPGCNCADGSCALR